MTAAGRGLTASGEHSAGALRAGGAGGAAEGADRMGPLMREGGGVLVRGTA